MVATLFFVARFVAQGIRSSVFPSSAEKSRWRLSQTGVPFLTSLIAHLVAVLLLALLTYGAGGLGEQDSLLSASWISEPEPFAAIVPVEPATSVPNLATDLTSELAATASSPIHVVTTEPTVEPMDASASSDRDRTLLNPVTEAIDQIRSASVQAATKEAFSMTSVASRQGANRKINVQKRGGNEASEKAVEAALKWLARHQNADGGWNLHLDAPCDGKCTHGSIHSDPQRAAATGLAILCFLGAGYTHQDGPYQKVVHDGLYYLLQIAKTDKRGAHFHQPIAQFSMYEHGIATLALCEAYQMTNDESLRKCVEDAMYFIFSAQHTDGGWGYDPKTPGDLSIACWQMMAVKSALASKIRVQMDSIKVFDRFLDSQQSDGGAMYGYRSTKPRPSTTAMGS